MSADQRWSLILHGGAKQITPELEGKHRRGLAAALRCGEELLGKGSSALDAVEATVRQLEDDPTFNAGYGSVLNAAGQVEMDAAIMDGRTLEVGGVGAIQGVRNPVSVARRILSELPVLLVGEGARRFASEHGIELCDPRALIYHEMEHEDQRIKSAVQGRDTVGCVARDVRGNIAAGTSTGGLTDKHPGRIGDSPLVGAGVYADDAVGGVSLSGDGESIIRMMLAARIMHALPHQQAQTASEAAIEALARVGGEAGAIVIDRDGRIGWAHNSSHFAIAYRCSEQPTGTVCLSKSEQREASRDHG